MKKLAIVLASILAAYKTEQPSVDSDQTKTDV